VKDIKRDARMKMPAKSKKQTTRGNAPPHHSEVQYGTNSHVVADSPDNFTVLRSAAYLRRLRG